MKIFIHHNILDLFPFWKELIRSVWGHGFLFIGLVLFTLLRPQAPFRSEKYISVNLRNLGGSVGPSTGGPSLQKPAQMIAPVKPPAPQEIKKETLSQPKVQQKITPPPTPPQQKVQKLTPKAPTQQKIAPPVAKPQSKTPSLSQRLKNRFEEVQSVQSTKKFVEPQQFVEAKQATPASKHHFVEPEEWSKTQKSGAGIQTQMSAVGVGTGTGSGDGKEFPFAWYLEMIQNKITMNWKEPPKPLLDSKDLSAIVSFSISRDGQIQKITLAGASSLQTLNQSVIEAVQVSNPLPPLPADFVGNQLNVKIKFELTE